jgi:phytoene dehydrogenase-like protein
LTRVDAAVVGSGPNGLAAAIELAHAGLKVRVFEAAASPGGGARTAELTLPGFQHDVCSAVHPLAVASPFFSTLPLSRHGVEWVHPPLPLAHPLETGPPVLLERGIAATAATLGPDAGTYTCLMEPLLEGWKDWVRDALGPLRWPHHPTGFARFGVLALASAVRVASHAFTGSRGRALFGGLAAHSALPLDKTPSAAFGWVLALAGHAVGWPFPRGGAGRLTDALVAICGEAGARIDCERPIESMFDLPPARAYLFDVTPGQLARIASDVLPHRYQRRLERFRHGPGSFKVDWALSEPIPWRDEECCHAGTIHLGGSFEEIARAEADVWDGRHPDRPFVLLAQPSLFDPTRAPTGKHTAWAYCHVVHGSACDMTAAIEAQVERFAPGFRDCVIARHSFSAAELSGYNANYTGGDITGGVMDLGQLFARPVGWRRPYETPVESLYLCSASTPPGGGVHGMCGFHAARAAIRRSFRACEPRFGPTV